MKAEIRVEAKWFIKGATFSLTFVRKIENIPFLPVKGMVLFLKPGPDEVEVVDCNWDEETSSLLISCEPFEMGDELEDDVAWFLECGFAFDGSGEDWNVLYMRHLDLYQS